VNENRLGDNTTLLSRQVSNNVMNDANVKTNDIGKETKSMIERISANISEALKLFNSSRYINGNSVTTTQSPLL
jgi:hypothetical protein